jgi:hypothetical protein
LQAFWAKVETDAAVFKETPGFLVAVRAFILGVVTISYESVPTAFLGECLNLSGGELDAVIKGEGYSKDGETVTIPGNGENQLRPKKFKENIEFGQMLSMIHVLR